MAPRTKVGRTAYFRSEFMDLVSIVMKYHELI